MRSIASGSISISCLFGVFAMSDPVQNQMHEFMIARAGAVQAYATIEQSLCTIFASMLQVPNAYAGVVFFRMSTARARNATVEALVRKRLGSEFNPFMNSIVAMLKQIDQRRNEIVHWHMVHSVSSQPQGPLAHSWSLTPPNFWDMSASTPKINISDLEDFSSKCDVIHRALNMFHVATNPSFALPDETRQSWLERFRQPLAYPLPDTHPLSRNYKEP